MAAAAVPQPQANQPSTPPATSWAPTAKVKRWRSGVCNRNDHHDVLEKSPVDVSRDSRFDLDRYIHCAVLDART